jgi:hypothetical protein
MMLVRLRLCGGTLPLRSSSVMSPRWTAERVSRARIPQDEGPCSLPIRSKARRARACTDEMEVLSMAWEMTWDLAAFRSCCFVEAMRGSEDRRRVTTTIAYTVMFQGGLKVCGRMMGAQGAIVEK